MDKKTRIKVRVCGLPLNVASDESEEYVAKIAQEVNDRMIQHMSDEKSINFNMAAILTALNLCDELTHERLMNKITVDKDEVQALQKKLEAAQTAIEELKKNHEQEIEEYKKTVEKLRMDWAMKEQELLGLTGNI